MKTAGGTRGSSLIAGVALVIQFSACGRVERNPTNDDSAGFANHSSTTNSGGAGLLPTDKPPAAATNGGSPAKPQSGSGGTRDDGAIAALGGGGVAGGASEGGAAGGASEGGVAGGASEGGVAGGASEGGVAGVVSEGGVAGVASEGGVAGVVSEGGVAGIVSEGGVAGVASEGGASACPLVNPAIATPSCSGEGLIYEVTNLCLDDGGLSVSDDLLEVYCCGGVKRFCLSGEECPWRAGCANDAATCSRAGLAPGTDWMAVINCCEWGGPRDFYCSEDGQIREEYSENPGY